ncbi:hypothetical protein G6F42_004527 [Rhizopus arrhizus]|nr:hypothetical protein G6F42_004527 [Rhizopus arrhizus]
MRKQKGVHEICKRFIHSSAKYDEKATTGVRTSTKKENRYYPSAPVRMIKKALKKYCGKQLDICMVDEYLTSQICNKCKTRNVDNVVTAKSKRRVHTVLRCKQNNCNIIWNRDIMAAHNILDIFLFAAKNKNQRLDAFVR